MLARVSSIESFRRWREDEDQTVDDLIRFITTDEPTPAMAAGTAFHAALETARPGDHEKLEAQGYTFLLSGGAVHLPVVRELRVFGQFGPLRVTGQCDALDGRVVIDHKTTSRFDAERYLTGCQWKFYLELFGADVFQWNVFEIREVGEKTFVVDEPQVLRAYRYPAMRDYCERLASDYFDFASQWMPAAA